MDEVGDRILDAWSRIRPRLENDPEDVRKRLQRGRDLWLKRPPRAWCLAVRASDHRINPATAACVPEDAAYPRDHVAPRHRRSYGPHTVTLTRNLCACLCEPVALDRGGEVLADVAAKVGRGSGTLRAARALGVFSHRHVPQVRNVGKPIPILHAQAHLDPGQRLLCPPDPVWGWTGKLWEWRIPEDFPAQEIERIPFYADLTARYADKSHLHPEDPRVDPPCTPRPSYHVPPPEPDCVWYKWKGNEFVGYDWRAAERNPRIKEHYERHERAKRKSREAARRRRRDNPPPSQAGGSAVFGGWYWLCPVCARKVKVIFYPLPPVNIIRGYGSIAHDALIDPIEAALGPPVHTLRPIQTFACDRCHHVRPFARVDRNGWNEVICYLTGGLLYGREVPKPDWLTPDRKRPYRPIASREPSQRRAQVQERLLKGWSYKQIATDLKVSQGTVMSHATKIYAQHGVHSRYDLAKMLGVKLKKTAPYIQQVRDGLARGLTCEQIVDETGISRRRVKQYVAMLTRFSLSDACGGAASRAIQSREMQSSSAQAQPP